MKNTLEVKNISYSVGENKILKDISFKCQSGEIIGIIGPNGSGKTTLLKTINGINSISSGDILLNGKSTKEYDEKELARDISFMNQNTNIEFDFPCIDIVVLGRYPYLERFQEYSKKDMELAEKYMKLTNTYKFKDKSYLCELFANCILSDGEVCKIIRKYDIILPVPLHKKRFKERGYNQSKLISDILAQKLGVQTFDDVLVKIKNTLPQGKNLLHDRRKAIKGAFCVENPNKIRGKNVLIFDDIYTTGNTANECKKIIEESGAKSVEILTIAKDYIL